MFFLPKGEWQMTAPHSSLERQHMGYSITFKAFENEGHPSVAGMGNSVLTIPPYFEALNVVLVCLLFLHSLWLLPFWPYQMCQ